MSDQSYETFTRRVKAARSAGTPLLAITTSDQAACQNVLAPILRVDDPVMVQYDIAAGVSPIGDAGREWIKTHGIDQKNDDYIANPAEFFASAARELPEGGIVFAHGCHLWHEDKMVEQTLLAIRDEYKTTLRTVILLGPSTRFGASLDAHITKLDEPLPTAGDLREIVSDVYEDAQKAQGHDFGSALPSESLDSAVAAVLGLPAFGAEQATAMSLKRRENAADLGLDLGELWERKRAMINATAGLSVYDGPETFADIGGLDRIKEFLGRIRDGNRPPRGIVFVDEIEKALSGSSSGAGDTSGVSQGILQQLLMWLQDSAVRGILLLGVPGAGKSLISKALGNECECLTLAYDLNGLKGSLVGESEAAQREAHKIIDAVAPDPLFIATCNSLASIPPELKRRCDRGTFFFDTPTVSERDIIWQLYGSKYDVDVDVEDRPEDEGWTGAEIKSCVEQAGEYGISVKDASQYITPVAVTARDRIEQLRKDATDRYQAVSSEYANTSGRYDREKLLAAPKSRRRAVRTVA